MDRIWEENKMTYQERKTAHVHTHAGEVRKSEKNKPQ